MLSDIKAVYIDKKKLSISYSQFYCLFSLLKDSSSKNKGVPYTVSPL